MCKVSNYQLYHSVVMFSYFLGRLFVKDAGLSIIAWNWDDADVPDLCNLCLKELFDLVEVLELVLVDLILVVVVVTVDVFSAII